MVVGPFAQGIFLMGIIYWYSKGLMNLINDYYRSEFNRKLKTIPVNAKNFEMKRDVYDLDDMDELIRLERLRDAERMELAAMRQVVGDIVEEPPKGELECNVNSNGNCANLSFMDMDSELCYRPNLKLLFLNIILELEDCLLNSKVMYTENINYPICLLNESVT
ncbi:exit protein of rhodopsin and TRP B [Musca autumnalis]|uniref:exit protein of rhodopsin and TRP B n=1 Tax=Musca autumnalis TaxID=221902 RepID=UPI003CEBBF8E